MKDNVLQPWVLQIVTLKTILNTLKHKVVAITFLSIYFMPDSLLIDSHGISFRMCTILKVFIEFVTILLLFSVLFFFAAKHVGSQLPDKGWNPHSLHWKMKS